MAQYALGHERGFAEQAERDQDKATQRREFELDQGNEQLDREYEEGDHHHRPSQQQDRDL